MQREPEWIDFKSLAAAARGYEEQIEARPQRGEASQWRHRQVVPSDQPEPAWTPGRAPN